MSTVAERPPAPSATRRGRRLADAGSCRLGSASRSAFLAFFVAIPPLTIRSPVPTIILGVAALAAAACGDPGRGEAARLGCCRGGRRGHRGRYRCDQVRCRQPRARGRLVGAVRGDAALRDAAAVRRARRPAVRAQRRHQHRPRGHDADGRLLGRLGGRGHRLLAARPAHRHGVGRAAGAHPRAVLDLAARGPDRVRLLDEPARSRHHRVLLREHLRRHRDARQHPAHARRAPAADRGHPVLRRHLREPEHPDLARAAHGLPVVAAAVPHAERPPAALGGREPAGGRDGGPLADEDPLPRSRRLRRRWRRSAAPTCRSASSARSRRT